MRKILIFLLLTSVCFGNIEVTESVSFTTPDSSQAIDVSFHPAATESYGLIFPAEKGTVGQPLVIDSIVNDAITLIFDTASTAAAHDILSATHDDSTTDAVTRGSIIYGNATPKWDELVIGAANTVFVSDGTDPSWGTVDISDGTNLAVDTDHFLLDDDTIKFSVNQDTNLHFWQGSFLEQHDFTITEAGGTVTGNLEKEGTGDLTMYFSDEFTVLDCTAPLCTVDLTGLVGTDASPAESFVYIPQSTKTLTAAASWPAASVEHIRVANIVLQSAATTGTDGALQNRNWNDFAFGITDPRGHGLHITQNIRANHAKWLSGVALTVTGDGTGTITLDNSAGVISQLHEQAFPALDMAGADDIHIVNQVVDEGGNYETSVNLVADVTHFVDGTDAGTAFTVNRYFNLVIWGVQNRTGETSHLMLNLPTGQYTSESGAKADGNNFSVRSIPSAFTGTGFLIGELTFRLTGGGATWTLVQEKSLLGIPPGTTAGGGVTTTATVFSDASFRVFDNGDDSKIIAFEASSITTGNTRTLTAPDVDTNMWADDGSVPLTANWDVGAFDIRSQTLTADSLSSTRVIFASANGLLVGDGDLTFDSGTGVLTVLGLGTGGQTDYDLKVGDTDGTPTYGMIQIGNACIGRTSFKAGNIDLDGSIIYRNIAGPVTSEIEHVFVESTGDSTRFALAKAGVGNATYNSRSMLIAGPAPADTDYVKVTYWQTNNNIFDNLACDTSGVGADLGVQNDLEVEGDIFVDSIKESTAAAGISFNSFGINNVGTIGSGAITSTGAVQGSSLTDGTMSIASGNLTSVGNITGTDVDISAGTGDYSSTGDITGSLLTMSAEGAGQGPHIFENTRATNGATDNTIDIRRNVATGGATLIQAGDGTTIRLRTTDDTRSNNVASIVARNVGGSAARDGEFLIFTANGNALMLAMTIDENQEVLVDNGLTANDLHADNGFSGSWENSEGDTVTVVDGIITSVVSP